MIAIRCFQRLAEAVPPEIGMTVLLLAVTLAAVAVAWRDHPAELRRNAPGLGYLALSSILLLAASQSRLPWPMIAVLVVASPLLLIAQLKRDTTEPAASPIATGRRFDTIYLPIVAALAGLLLLADLAGYAGTVLVWEYDTAAGFEVGLRAGQSVPRFTLQRLLWDDGLVSSGDHSLIYGSATYALWRVAGASIFTLRLAAAVLALACLGAVWMVGRCVGDRTVAAAAVVLLALNPALIFYGRYGSSPSGSLLAVLLAFWACSLLAHPNHGRWWTGLLAGGALFLVTLGYSTGRLAAIGMLVAIALAVATGRCVIDRQRIASLVLLLAALTTVWMVQRHFGTSWLFVNARGEQVVTTLKYPDGIRAYLGREISPDELEWADRVQIVRAFLETTVPQALAVFALPVSDEATPRAILHVDPPRLPLYQGILLVFAGWGLASALRRIGRPVHLLVLATLAMTTLPILLTNRVDSHRLMMATVPLVLLAALGLREIVRVAHECGLPAGVLHGCGAILVTLAAASTSSLLYYDSPPVRPLVDSIEDRIMATPKGPIQIVTDMNPRDLGRIRLRLIERWRRTPSRNFMILTGDAGLSLSDHHQSPAELLAELESMIDRGPVIVAPADRYRQTAHGLENRGFVVEELGPLDGRYWLVTASATESAGL
jgi:4-amino-4-deoxy-L-arabinose transferase-like glycosyltransferase